MTRLSDALKAANVDKLSTRAIEKAAAKAGHSIHYSTVSLYMSGKHGEPDEPTLAALAAVLPISLGELREAAGLPHETDEPYSAPSVAARLDPRQRRAVDEIIRLLAKAGEGSGQQPATTKMSDYVEADADAEAGVVTELKDRRSKRERELERMAPAQVYLHLARATPGADRDVLIAELDRRGLPVVPSPENAVAAFGVLQDYRPQADNDARIVILGEDGAEIAVVQAKRGAPREKVRAAVLQALSYRAAEAFDGLDPSATGERVVSEVDDADSFVGRAVEAVVSVYRGVLSGDDVVELLMAASDIARLLEPAERSVETVLRIIGEHELVQRARGVQVAQQVQRPQSDDLTLAAMSGTPAHIPDGVTGEESQDPGSDEPA